MIKCHVFLNDMSKLMLLFKLDEEINSMPHILVAESQC